jgi:agmatine deiminase
MAWPCREKLWLDRIDAARRAYAVLARSIAQYEPVTMIAREADVADASVLCGSGVDVLPLAIDDSWIRDTGPTFLTDGAGGRMGVAWRFNGWGEKFTPYGDDAALAEALLDRLGIAVRRAPIVLEGGAFCSDGDGTLLITEQCALNPNRNPAITRAAMTEVLQDVLGIRKVIWLAGGFESDETEGHVDNVARFTGPGDVLAVTPGDAGDADFETLSENLARLSEATDAGGRPLNVWTLPRPAPRVVGGRVLPQSYANFYVANGAVIVPSFNDPADPPAAAILAKAFPKRRIESVPAQDIAYGGGAVHCATLEEPVSRPG